MDLKKNTYLSPEFLEYVVFKTVLFKNVNEKGKTCFGKEFLLLSEL